MSDTVPIKASGSPAAGFTRSDHPAKLKKGIIQEINVSFQAERVTGKRDPALVPDRPSLVVDRWTC